MRKRKLLVDVHGEAVAIGTPCRRRYVVTFEELYAFAKMNHETKCALASAKIQKEYEAKHGKAK